MGKYVFLRLLNYIVLLFIAINLTYFLAASQLHPRILFLAINPPMDPVSVDNTLYAYNLNDKTPIVERWWAWLTGVFLDWDWGSSPRGDSVNNQISQRVWVSLRLILIGSIAGTVLGVLAGAVSAIRQYKPTDRILTFVAMLLNSMPSFVIATILIVLATKFNTGTGTRLFEFTGETGAIGDYTGATLADRIQHLVLPTAALILLGFAFYSRVQRGLMLDTLGADYVRTARAKGLPAGKAVMRHALRTALIPTGTYFAFSIATLFTGATIMESLFSFSGMGIYGVSTIQGQDINGTVAVTAFAGASVLVGAILSDVTVAILDPRVRLS